MSKMSIWDSRKSVPPEYTKKINGGRMSGKTNISPQWRLKALTELFGPCGIGWRYETVERWLDEAGGEISAHVRINLYIIDSEPSEAIEGQGGSMLLAKEKSGLHHSDEAWKMATTDAISVACKQLGIGADVYMGDGDKYTDTKPDTPESWKDSVLKRLNNIKVIDEEYRESLREKIESATRDRDQKKAEDVLEAIQRAESGN